LEGDMKSAVSCKDLQRAIGLALGEVDDRMEEVFRDSNKRMLSMFARRDDVNELQGLMVKKVNWVDHNTVLKKLAELRTYIDTMTNSVFVKHIEAINAEFAKKADAATAGAALKLKADVSEVNDLQARLERLEELVTHAKHEQSTAVQALADKTTRDIQGVVYDEKALVERLTDAVSTLRSEHGAVDERVTGVEARVDALNAYSHENRDTNRQLRHAHEHIVWLA